MTPGVHVDAGNVLGQAEAPGHADGVFLVAVTKQTHRCRFTRELIPGQDTELGKPPHWVPGAAVVSFVAPILPFRTDSQQTALEVHRPNRPTVAVAGCSPVCYLVFQLLDLVRYVVKQPANLLRLLLQLSHQGFVSVQAGAGQNLPLPGAQCRPGCCVVLLFDGSHQLVDVLLYQLTVESDVVSHASGQSGLGTAKGNGVQVADDNVPVPQAHGRCRHFPGNHLPGLVIEVTVVGRAAGVAQDDTNPGTPAGTTTPLCIVVRPWRHVAHDNGIQPTDVDAHFQRW